MRGLTSDIAVLPATVIQKVLLLWQIHKANPDGFAVLLEAGPTQTKPIITAHRLRHSRQKSWYSLSGSAAACGVNPNVRNTNREPLTFVAAMEGNWPHVQLLIDRGAHPTFKIKDALVKTRIGAQPILELIFHYKIDAKSIPARHRCTEKMPGVRGCERHEAGAGAELFEG
jgi:hypothetical protein